MYFINYNCNYFISDVGQKAQKFMKNGQLVPDDVMVKLISNELSQIKTSSWLLDGFPRTRPQAEALHKHEKVILKQLFLL